MIDFNEMVENFVRRESRPKTIGRYYPSEIGICLRKVWYSYIDPKEINTRLLKIFSLGHMIHDYVVEVLKSEKNSHIELIKSEFPFKEKVDDFLISGRIDNLILIKSDQTKLLIEVKSTADVRSVLDASPHNVDQIQLYMHFIGIKDGVVLYVDKKDMNSKVFYIQYNEKHALKLLDKFRKLHMCLTKEIVPEPESRMNVHKKWMCRMCEYREVCYKETPAEILG
jgi:CRISPR/Cas system-associated exonuclease Cas4 (RecB family)